MTVFDLQRPETQDPITDSLQALPQPRDPGILGPRNVRNAFVHALNQVNDAQSQAGQQVEAFIAGEQENLHEVMITMNQAKLSFQLMVEVRNKMMETYQELSRMQV